ncbi:hypothetical protein WJX72_009233 [[Myrmecia] bisecta]|uniref:Uncharacterized protein n=1 Tax=[Myrmecia] bisecta TaxID=41462 RepID=A0AAW1QT74_9CHLO
MSVVQLYVTRSGAVTCRIPPVNMTPNAPAPANKALDATKAGLGVRPQPTGGVGPNAFVQLRARADCLSKTVGGVAGPLAALLEQNYAILNSFKQNMAQYKVNENTDLLVRFRDNILTILNQMNSMQGVMSQMPPLPVRLNVELANNFLPKQPTGMYPGGIPGMPPPIGPLGGMPMNGFMMGPIGLKAKSPTGPSRPAAATPAKLKAEPQAVKPQ